MNRGGRIVCWFSCGMASAVATKLTIQDNPHADVRVVYCDTASEHPDNRRFLRECEAWFGLPIKVIRSERYADIWDVFEKTRWLVGVKGARCTTELKKVPRHAYQKIDDIQVWGYTSDESRRIATFEENNPEIRSSHPLADRGISKAECARILAVARIERPAMYRLGYRNNNCIGCVKGQQGYWNKIRKDFPSVFDRMARVERDIGAAINKRYEGDTRIPIYLDELDPDAGNYAQEPGISCGPVCGVQMALWEPVE